MAKKLGDARRVPYRIDEVVKAKHIFIVEGEKDADTCVEKLGFAASTNSMGAGKWRSEHDQYLRKNTSRSSGTTMNPAANTCLTLPNDC